MNHPLNKTIYEIIPPCFGGGAKNGINVSLKNAHKAYIHCLVGKGADATQTTFTLQQSSGNAGSAAGTGEKALSANVPIWISDGVDADPTLTATTDAKAYQHAVTQSVCQKSVFEVDPIKCMDLANGFECITVNATDPGAANSIHVWLEIIPRIEPLPNAFVD